MKEVLCIEQLTKKIITGNQEERELIKQLDLSLNQGDFVTVLGGNGAGKSTLFNLISGTMLPSSGYIEVNGTDVTMMKEERRARVIARVFQDPKLGTAPRMTVAENLLLAMKRGEKRRLLPRRLEASLPYFEDLTKELGNGLEKHLLQPTGALSGGQRQSLSLLMATLDNPSLLLLDEHTAALDPKTADRLMHLTAEKVKEKNLTALMITHKMEDALTYGNKLLVLEQGRIKYFFNESEKAALTKIDLLNFF